MYILPKVAKLELEKYLKAIYEIPTAELWFNVGNTLFVAKTGLGESLIRGFKFMAYKLKCYNDQNTLTTVANERMNQKNYDVKLTRFTLVLYMLQQQKVFFLKTWSFS